jgi:hypothetical protein
VFILAEKVQLNLTRLHDHNKIRTDNDGIKFIDYTKNPCRLFFYTYHTDFTLHKYAISLENRKTIKKQVNNKQGK